MFHNTAFNKPFLTFLLLILLSGCHSYYYAPSSHHVPLHEEKNELKISGSAGTNLEIASYDLQASYSLTENIAVMINTQYAEGDGNGLETGEDISGNGHVMELGAGYFLPYADHLVFETFVGVGRGRVINRYDEFTLSSMGFTKVFLQPQIGFGNENFGLALSSRLVMLNYQDPVFQGRPSGQVIEETTLISQYGNIFLIEPGITARAGLEGVKVQVQLVVSPYMSELWFFDRSQTNISVGLFLDL